MVKLEVFKGNVYAIVISIIMRFLGHNSFQFLLRPSQVRMINQA